MSEKHCEEGRGVKAGAEHDVVGAGAAKCGLRDGENGEYGGDANGAGGARGHGNEGLANEAGDCASCASSEMQHHEHHKGSHKSANDSVGRDDVCAAKPSSSGMHKGEVNDASVACAPCSEVEQLKDIALRAAAENQNLRRRHAKEVDDARRYAISSLVLDVTEVMENLYSAKAHTMKEQDGQRGMRSIIEGLDLTIRTLEKVFERHHIKRIFPLKGELFDHAYHEALSVVDVQGCEGNTVAEVVRAGYMLNDRLLKPALVVVVKMA